jgi:hypothetical protein
MTGRGGRLLQQILAKKEAEEGKKTPSPPPTIPTPQQQVEDAPQPQQSLQQQTDASATAATTAKPLPVINKKKFIGFCQPRGQRSVHGHYGSVY